MDRLVLVSIFFTARSARGAIQLDVQTSAGSGVDAQAESKIGVSKASLAACKNFILKGLMSLALGGKPYILISAPSKIRILQSK